MAMLFNLDGLSGLFTVGDFYRLHSNRIKKNTNYFVISSNLILIFNIK